MEFTFRENRIVFENEGEPNPGITRADADKTSAGRTAEVSPGTAATAAGAPTEGTTAPAEGTAAPAEGTEAPVLKNEIAEKALSDREALLKTMESGGLSTDLKNEMFEDLAAYITKVAGINDLDNLDAAKKKLLSSVQIRLTARSQTWKESQPTLAGLLKDIKNQQPLAETIVNEVFANLQITPDIRTQWESVKSEGKTPVLRLNVAFDKTSGKFNVGRAVDEQNVPEGMTKEEFEKAKNEFKNSTRGKLVLFLLSMFGFVDGAKLKDPSEKEALIDEIIRGENAGGAIVAGLFGFNFGKKYIGGMMDMMPEGPMKDKAKEFVNNASQTFGKWGNAPTQELTDAKILEVINGNGTNAKALTANWRVGDKLTVDAEKPLMIKVPAGKFVVLLEENGKDVLKGVHDNAGKLVNLDKDGSFKATAETTLKIDPKTIIGKGSFLVEGTTVWYGEKVVAEAPAPAPAQ